MTQKIMEICLISFFDIVVPDRVRRNKYYFALMQYILNQQERKNISLAIDGFALKTINNILAQPSFVV